MRDAALTVSSLPSQRPGIQQFLLIATVIGFVVPNAMLIAFLATNGPQVGDYFAAWVDTLPAAQLTVDLGICSAVFLTWAMVDGARTTGVRAWVAIPATFLVGLCFAIPLYLLMRERAPAPHAASPKGPSHV